MSKGHILGPKPAKDPIDEVRGPSHTIESNTELKWQNRSVRQPWFEAVGVIIIIILIVVYAPVFVFALTTGAALILFVVSKILVWNIQSAGWKNVSEPDMSVTSSERTVEVRGLGAPRRVMALDHSKAGSLLAGNLGRLIRAIDTNVGFCLIVTMQYEKSSLLMQNDIMREDMEEYLSFLPKDLLEAYMARRGGLWKTRMFILGQATTASDVRFFENSVRGAIPESGLKRISSRTLKSIISRGSIGLMPAAYYASGEELANWLVQLKSELASEVGSNVPGEFVTPIRSSPSDYRLGVSINPETLLEGAAAGVSHEDLELGLLLCGGVHSERVHVIALLIKRLLDEGTRVLIATRHKEVKALSGLSEESVVFRLGDDLILNPVDAEGVPRLRHQHL